MEICMVTKYSLAKTTSVAICDLPAMIQAALQKMNCQPAYMQRVADGFAMPISVPGLGDTILLVDDNGEKCMLLNRDSAKALPFASLILMMTQKISFPFLFLEVNECAHKKLLAELRECANEVCKRMTLDSNRGVPSLSSSVSLAHGNRYIQILRQFDVWRRKAGIPISGETVQFLLKCGLDSTAVEAAHQAEMFIDLPHPREFQTYCEWMNLDSIVIKAAINFLYGSEVTDGKCNVDKGTHCVFIEELRFLSGVDLGCRFAIRVLPASAFTSKDPQQCEFPAGSKVDDRVRGAFTLGTSRREFDYTVALTRNPLNALCCWALLNKNPETDYPGPQLSDCAVFAVDGETLPLEELAERILPVDDVVVMPEFGHDNLRKLVQYLRKSGKHKHHMFHLLSFCKKKAHDSVSALACGSSVQLVTSSNLESIDLRLSRKFGGGHV
jgi:hypothetical protein